MARGEAREEEVDLFAPLIAELADALCALPPEAWSGADRRGGGAEALADRLARLQAARAALGEEPEEREMEGNER